MDDIVLYQGDCLEFIRSRKPMNIDLSICDPPFNQKKVYKHFDDNQNEKAYWKWIEDVLKQIYRTTAIGGSIYFMHREKNVEHLFRIMRKAKWVFQNLIIWRKMTRTTPSKTQLGKKYQVIFSGTKGDVPLVHNQLYGVTPMLSWHKKDSSKGVYIDDLWYDIRELTSGFFAGKEVIRNKDRTKAHRQQMPLALALRMILMSTSPGDKILDPFLGTRTTMTVAKQLNRRGIGIEIDSKNLAIARKRVSKIGRHDNIDQYYGYYSTTKNINDIWGYRKQKTLDHFAKE